MNCLLGAAGLGLALLALAACGDEAAVTAAGGKQPSALPGAGVPEQLARSRASLLADVHYRCVRCDHQGTLSSETELDCVKIFGVDANLLYKLSKHSRWWGWTLLHRSPGWLT